MPVVSAAFGPDGRLWRVTPDRDSLAVDHSDDRAKTFATPVMITPHRQRLRADAEGRAQIAVDGKGVVYVAWTADARKPMQSFVTWSTDGGKTFATPVSPGDPAPAASQLRPLLKAGADGAHLYFLAMSEGGARGSTLFETTVSPAGIGKPATIRVGGPTCECCRLAAAAEPDGALVVLSRMVFDGGIRDFGLFRKPPAGAWSAVVRLTDDDWRIDACPEHGGALAIGTDGRYHLAWFTQGARRQGLFYAWSDDRGRSASPPLRIGLGPGLPGHADVLAAKNAIYLVWQQFDGSATSILGMTSTDNGQSWSAPRVLARDTGAADYPFLLTDGAATFVSWYAAGSGYRLLPVTIATAGGIRPFGAGSYAQVLAEHSQKPFLLVLWSVTCVPCREEFEMLRDLRKTSPQMTLVLVSTDDVADRAMAAKMLERYGLGREESWIFADGNAAKLRFEIDPSWYGEMPRSYFYDAAHRREAVSGTLERTQVESWLKDE